MAALRHLVAAVWCGAIAASAAPELEAQNASEALSTAQQAPSAADVAAARELFRQGARAAQSDNWEEARKAYERSYALRPSALTRYSLALAQMNTARLVEALENFRAFLREPMDAVSSQYRAPAQAAIQELQTKVASVLVTSSPAHAKVLLDGVALRPAAIGVRRPLDPGRHRLEATAPGYEPFLKEFTVDPAGAVEIAIQLRRATAVGEVAHAPAPAASRHGAEGRANALPVALLAGGGALLAGGIVVGVLGIAKASDAPTHDGSDAKTARTLGVVGDVMGGVGLVGVGLGTWLLLSRGTSSSPAGAATACSPWISARSAGVSLGGSF